MEYAMGSDPFVPELGGFAIDADANDVTLTFDKYSGKIDISWVVEWTEDMEEWDMLATALLSTNGTVETRRASVPVGGRLQILRLKVMK